MPSPSFRNLFNQLPDPTRPQKPLTPTFGQAGYSGLSQFKGQNERGATGVFKTPSTYQRSQNPGEYMGFVEEMRATNPSALPPSEQAPRMSGRGRYDPQRVAERALKAESRRIDQQLSPFAQAQGFPMPQQMSRNSVFGAMNQPFTIYH